MKDLPQIVIIIGFIVAFALAIAAVLMPIVVICIDSRLAKVTKSLAAAERSLYAMESMMRNKR